jgi:hypothetical protein
MRWSVKTSLFKAPTLLCQMHFGMKKPSLKDLAWRHDLTQTISLLTPPAVSAIASAPIEICGPNQGQKSKNNQQQVFAGGHPLNY